MFDFTGPAGVIWTAAGLFYCLILLLISLRSTYFTICLLLGIVTFGNFLVEYQILPEKTNWLTEPAIFLLFLKSMLEKKVPPKQYRLFFPYTIFFFCIFTAGSIIVNNSSILGTLLCLRLMFRYVLLFIALINLDLSNRDVFKLNRLVAGLVLIQVPVAIVKFFLYGQGEMAVGTYAGVHGGELSTILPLAAIPFAIGYYLQHKKSLLYILVGIAFVVYSVIGGKRAFIFYLIPLFVYLFFVFRRHIVPALQARELILGVTFLLGTFFFITNSIDTLNPNKVGKWLGNRNRQGYGAIIDFVLQYNTKESEGGISQGRISSTLKTFEIISKEGILGLAFGLGPGTLMESRFSDSSRIQDVAIGYGKTEFNWTLYQFGIFATIIYFMIPIRLLLFTGHHHSSFQDGYWQAFFFGLNAFCFTMILIGLTYSFTMLHDFLPCIFLYLAAIAVKKTSMQDRLSPNTLYT
ncbi:MAG: hypothetical protein SV375_14065 [Thermodesulfobacteriota bacterium]|nr:hypothetical protein [Thermodesulfobacteriota bacterium]